jgi:2-phosphosulfolactate phosphatase
MTTRLEVLFTPADFAPLAERNLSDTVCVVFDVLRATSSMIAALGNGAAALLPVETIAEALAARQRQPDVLLAGERDGVRIRAELSGGGDFDLGNSPREFTAERVTGRTIVMTTTNGTRALRACATARTVLASSFLNLGVTAGFLERERPANLLLVCSGTFEEAALEDVLGAGALCELLWTTYGAGAVADSARMAHSLFLLERGNLADAFARSRNGRRLLSRPELRDDVAFCLRRDNVPLVATLDELGFVRRTD